MSYRYPSVAVLPGTGPESDDEGGSVSSRGSGVSQAAGPHDTLRFADLVNLHSQACRVVWTPMLLKLLASAGDVAQQAARIAIGQALVWEFVLVFPRHPSIRG